MSRLVVRMVSPPSGLGSFRGETLRRERWTPASGRRRASDEPSKRLGSTMFGIVSREAPALLDRVRRPRSTFAEYRNCGSRLRSVLCIAALAIAGVMSHASGEAASLQLRDVFPATGTQAGTFNIEYRDAGVSLQTAQLDEVAIDGNVLMASGHGYRITFAVQPRDTYLVLRITDVVEPKPGTLMKLSFQLTRGSRFTLTRLDYMTVPTHGDKGMSWPWIWGRTGDRSQESGVRSQGAESKRVSALPPPSRLPLSAPAIVSRSAAGGREGATRADDDWVALVPGRAGNPLGAFAIHTPANDAEFDENLLRMWVRDGLPHPKVEGEWTLERARAWLRDWQERFSDQSCLVIGAKDRAELDTMTEWAQKLGMKRVYLHTDTWRGEYWPANNSYLHVNTNVFPRGERDLNAYTAALREKGMSFAVHSTVISIGRNDPDYVRNGIHPGLARWVRGTLDRGTGARDGTLYLRPTPGSKYPEVVRHAWRGPDTMPHFMNLQMFLVGDELVNAGVVAHADGDVWVLKQCRRGEWGTQAAAHPAGTVTDGMVRGYGQALVPDCDSELFEETIRRWTAFCSRNNVDHLECDALEIHQDRPWGAGKFSWLLSSGLKLPSTSNTSGGRPLPFHIEYWFRSSREVFNNHARAGVAGGASLPLYLHSDIRQATGPYEILYKPGQMVGVGGQSFNVSYPWPMFGVTPEILANHGMVPEVENLIADWRAVLPDVAPEVREAMASEYGEYRGAAGRNNQRATDVLFRPEIVSCMGRVVPLRMVGRAGGELNWGFGQEFGPVVPRQYLRVGETIELSNVYHAQEPEFVIRVMGAMEDESEKIEHPTPNTQHPTSKEESSIEASYETGTTTDFSVHPLHAARHIWPASELHNGEAKRGKVEVRHLFQVSDLAALKRARLYVQVDDEAVAYVNGKKVFAGGRWDQALFVDLTDLRQGNNTLLIKATNYGAPGCVTAALHLDTADGTRVLASDGAWQGRAADGVWGAVGDLGAYGDNVWPKAEPQLSVLRTDLMPNGATIEQAQGHELTVKDGALHIVCRNASTSVVAYVDDRPGWATLLDMSDARGIGCTVTGDGSGAVLVISIGEHHKRDYAIPIDFTGTRHVEIPSGEVAWGHSKWGWRWAATKFDYSRIRKVQAGFGTVPPKTHAKVTVSNIRPLRQTAKHLQDLTIKVGAGRELIVPGTIPSGHYLWYKGGDTVGLYDLNWNKIRDLAVRKQSFTFPTGALTATLSAASPGRRSWFEVQFFTKGKPLL